MGVFRTSTRLTNEVLDTLNRALSAGEGPGSLSLYTGRQPQSADAPLDEAQHTLLLRATFAHPAAPSARGGTLTFRPLSPVSAVARGRATWARARDGNGTTVFDLDVASVMDNPAAGMVLADADFYEGRPLHIARFHLSFGTRAASAPPAPPRPRSQLRLVSPG